MMWADDLSDPRELRNYIRDLIALSALPATWKAYEPQRIAESVAAAMIAMLSPDFVYVSLPGASNHPSGEVTHVNPQMTLGLVNATKRILRPNRARDLRADDHRPFRRGSTLDCFGPDRLGRHAGGRIASARFSKQQGPAACGLCC
jgi:hypothetical protein